MNAKTIFATTLIIGLILIGISMFFKLCFADEENAEPKEFSYGTVSLVDTSNEYTVFEYHGYYLVDEKDDEYVVVTGKDINKYKKSDNLVCVQEVITVHDKAC